MYDRIKVSYDPQHMINMVTIKSRFFFLPYNRDFCCLFKTQPRYSQLFKCDIA